MNFSKKSHILKNVSRFKEKYKKIMIQVGMRLCKKNFWKNMQY